MFYNRVVYYAIIFSITVGGTQGEIISIILSSFGILTVIK